MLEALRNFFDEQLGGGVGVAAESRHALEIAAAALLVEVARIDGEMHATERASVLRAIHETFSLTDSQAARPSRSGRPGNDACRRLLPVHVAHQQQLFAGTKRAPDRADVRAAYADKDLSAHELHLMRKLAGLLHVSDNAYILAKLRAKHARGIRLTFLSRGVRSRRAHQFHQRVAITLELLFPDAADPAQRVDRARFEGGNRAQRAIVKHHVRGHAVQPGHLCPPRTQSFEERRTGLGGQRQTRRLPRFALPRAGLATCRRSSHPLLALEHVTGWLRQAQHVERFVVDRGQLRRNQRRSSGATRSPEGRGRCRRSRVSCVRISWSFRSPCHAARRCVGRGKTEAPLARRSERARQQLARRPSWRRFRQRLGGRGSCRSCSHVAGFAEVTRAGATAPAGATFGKAQHRIELVLLKARCSWHRPRTTRSGGAAAPRRQGRMSSTPRGRAVRPRGRSPGSTPPCSSARRGGRRNARRACRCPCRTRWSRR